MWLSWKHVSVIPRLGSDTYDSEKPSKSRNCHAFFNYYLVKT